MVLEWPSVGGLTRASDGPIMAVSRGLDEGQ